MGESQNQPFQLSFNRFLQVGFQGSRVNSDGGLIRVRELDERLGFGELVERYLTDAAAASRRFAKRWKGGAQNTPSHSFLTATFGGGWCCRRESGTGR